jgi:hypothetical protein
MLKPCEHCGTLNEYIPFHEPGPWKRCPNCVYFPFTAEWKRQHAIEMSKPAPHPSRVWDGGDFDRDMAHENGDEDFERDERRGWTYDPDSAGRSADFQEWVESLTGGKE